MGPRTPTTQYRRAYTSKDEPSQTENNYQPVPPLAIMCSISYLTPTSVLLSMWHKNGIPYIHFLFVALPFPAWCVFFNSGRSEMVR